MTRQGASGSRSSAAMARLRCAVESRSVSTTEVTQSTLPNNQWMLAGGVQEKFKIEP